MTTLPHSLFLILLFSFISSSFSIYEQNPDLVVQEVHKSINASRRNLGYTTCGTGNPIDDCWRCFPNWQQNRHRLSHCAIGFGKNTHGGRNGRLYVVSDSSDELPYSPKPGTLRHAVSQQEPLWIIFKRDMVIKLKHKLEIRSNKTIDGRGASVHIAYGPCLTIHNHSNIIIHGIHIHDCKAEGHMDGDGISISRATHVWLDHLSMTNCVDGLIDVNLASTAITISNSHFTHQNMVMLLGHDDSYLPDKKMHVTIAYNHFGVGLIQRIPRCRLGYFHIVNNDYYKWRDYAIGGSANPTIISEGNRFLAGLRKDITWHQVQSKSEWMHWNWRSEGDLMLNGAVFTQSGIGTAHIESRDSSLSAKPAFRVGALTSSAGALTCRHGYRC